MSSDSRISITPGEIYEAQMVRALSRREQCFTEYVLPVPVLAAYPLLIEFSLSIRS